MKRTLNALPEPVRLVARAIRHPVMIAQKVSYTVGLKDVARELGVLEELAFWDGFLGNKARWPQDFQCRFDPNLPLQEHVASWLDCPMGSEVKILDVGAGPLTALGKQCGGKKISITAVDMLANEYDLLLKKHHIEPLVRTTPARGEDLVSLFQPDQFDLVYARNCVDHMLDPLRAIQQMLILVKPNCHVLLEHVVNEGKKEGYIGLHQWNFFADDGEFFIANPHKTTNVSQELKAIATIECEVKGSWIITNLRKSSS